MFSSLVIETMTSAARAGGKGSRRYQNPDLQHTFFARIATVSKRRCPKLGMDPTSAPIELCNKQTVCQQHELVGGDGRRKWPNSCWLE